MPIDGSVKDLDVDVLIVDDDVLASTLIQLVIGKRAEARAVALQSTSEAVRLLRRAAAGQGGRLPKAVITDFRFGEDTSEAMVCLIRQSAAMSDLPVLMISADESRETRQAALDCGASSFVPKSKAIAAVPQWVVETIEGAARAAS
jgi:DNA-binding response OmpR family regulator